MPAGPYFRFARTAAAAAIALSIVTAVSYCLVLINALDSRTGIWLWLYGAKSGIEFIACIYGVFYLAVAAACRRPDDPLSRAAEAGKDGPAPRDLVVVYLCCDDLDKEALNSIAEFCSEAGCALFVHDDSSTAASRLLVKEFVAELQVVWRMQIRLLRRPQKSGGKPGAVNYVAESLHPGAEFLLLCDSDSFLPQQTDGIERALRFFVEPDVAIVQLCNISRTGAGASRGYHVLSESIDFNHVFVSFTDRFGWSPFLGHNALLRVSVFRSLGGFAPGQLADDVEFSVRVCLAGYRIRYAPFASAGERHPLSYTALRRRTAKWAYGCTQVLVRWAYAVMFSRRISVSEKATFFLTIGYYEFQVLMLFYLFIVYQILPFDPAGFSVGDTVAFFLRATPGAHTAAIGCLVCPDRQVASLAGNDRPLGTHVWQSGFSRARGSSSLPLRPEAGMGSHQFARFGKRAAFPARDRIWADARGNRFHRAPHDSLSPGGTRVRSPFSGCPVARPLDVFEYIRPNHNSHQ